MKELNQEASLAAAACKRQSVAAKKNEGEILALSVFPAARLSSASLRGIAGMSSQRIPRSIRLGCL
jgi:hypothetical protein